jgi:hypothetical protein
MFICVSLVTVTGSPAIRVGTHGFGEVARNALSTANYARAEFIRPRLIVKLSTALNTRDDGIFRPFHIAHFGIFNVEIVRVFV